MIILTIILSDERKKSKSKIQCFVSEASFVKFMKRVKYIILGVSYNSFKL